MKRSEQGNVVSEYAVLLILAVTAVTGISVLARLLIRVILLSIGHLNSAGGDLW